MCSRPIRIKSVVPGVHTRCAGLISKMKAVRSAAFALTQGYGDTVVTRV